MKFWIKEGNKKYTVNVSFWSVLKAYLITGLAVLVICYSLVTLLVNIFAKQLGIA